MNAYYRAAERLGVRVVYEADVRKLEMSDGRFVAASYTQGETPIASRRACLSRRPAGSNRISLAARSLGDRRPTTFWCAARHITWAGCCASCIDGGAQMIGDPTQCHASRSMRARRNSTAASSRGSTAITLGIVVNKRRPALLRRGRRYVAEALCDLGPAGRAAARSDCVLDLRRQVARTISCPRSFRPSRPIRSPILRRRLDLDPDALEQTVRDYNAAVRPGTFDHKILDDCTTKGSRRRNRIGRARSTRRRSGVIRSGPESRSRISASRSTSMRKC